MIEPTHRSYPFEAPVKLLTREYQRRRSAMRAVMRILNQVSLLQQGGDFTRCQAVSCLDGCLTGHHLQQLISHIATTR
jgi:hypothetical protein